MLPGLPRGPSQKGLRSRRSLSTPMAQWVFPSFLWVGTGLAQWRRPTVLFSLCASDVYLGRDYKLVQ
jgi:hypothetical protein